MSLTTRKFTSSGRSAPTEVGQPAAGCCPVMFLCRSCVGFNLVLLLIVKGCDLTCSLRSCGRGTRGTLVSLVSVSQAHVVCPKKSRLQDMGDAHAEKGIVGGKR